MGSDGSNQSRLTSNAAQDLLPSISPDSGHVAFLSNRDGYYAIYVMDMDGSNPMRLTDSLNYDPLSPGWLDPRITGRYYDVRLSPVWSPESKRIAYHSLSGGVLHIYLVGADGTAQKRLTAIAGVEFSPAWSPDGQRIVFVAPRDGGNDIFMINADGSPGETRLTRDRAQNSLPSWSESRSSVR